MPTDADLIQIAEAALTDSYTRAGDWMACKPGCHQCCIGVFPITTLDSARLRKALATATPTTATHIRRRASEARARLSRGARQSEAFGAAEHRFLEIDTGELRAREIGAVEIGAVDQGAGEDRVLQIGLA